MGNKTGKPEAETETDIEMGNSSKQGGISEGATAPILPSGGGSQAGGRRKSSKKRRSNKHRRSRNRKSRRQH